MRRATTLRPTKSASIQGPDRPLAAFVSSDDAADPTNKRSQGLPCPLYKCSRWGVADRPRPWQSGHPRQSPPPRSARFTSHSMCVCVRRPLPTLPVRAGNLLRCNLENCDGVIVVQTSVATNARRVHLQVKSLMVPGRRPVRSVGNPVSQRDRKRAR